jgi:hypothetical protein
MEVAGAAERGGADSQRRDRIRGYRTGFDLAFGVLKGKFKGFGMDLGGCWLVGWLVFCLGGREGKGKEGEQYVLGWLVGYD